MSEVQSPQPKPPAPPEEVGAGKYAFAASRRNWLKVGLAAAPVVLMHNRPTFASTSSCQAPSAWMSITVANRNGVSLSHQPKSSCSLGRSPGYWKQGYCDSNPYALVSPQAGNHAGCSYPASGATFHSIFGAGPTATFGTLLWQSPGSTEFHFVAAYLNAANSGNGSAAGITNYPISKGTVIAMYDGNYVDSTGTRWSQADGLNYIKSLES
ncbi:hypothetical protein GCM10011611_60270 [Aliidongia dinghuensis]|uniref:Uncharacterized protein n=1 Tax=Aliidongia dinghuensis TaxID=1867774 RepID=A0A8J2Z0N7_9PROT|nr:hypothetical protein [Aliidongia dinghuensis]GGF45796.1 hypothetical protein GCM10011611_60270 [Aliidongia dinghuensis]